jgi:hypothetical protein
MKTKTLLVLGFLCISIIGSTAVALVPSPDGGYPGGNAAEGENALLSLTTGDYDTAMGGEALGSRRPYPSLQTN